ncbi:hypothetical protein H8891_05345 [Paeniclostridium sp. NSJ-45]|uniref:Uncharacterized protein n=1 Tax=Paeniclostridium hominis TaxID=2764329 RepID=A0ABR7K299_9FIRM|nr:MULTISPECIES: hypothetical protein [Paeniclostridium]MBC6003217.1 hypothetical protein [Paeniclostridium hominis]
MKVKKLLFLVIGVNCIVLFSTVSISSLENKNLSQLQNLYFDTVDTDIKGKEMNLKKLKDINSNLDLKNNKNKVIDENEELNISYLEGENQINRISYEFKKENSDDIYLHTDYIKLKNGKLDLNLGIYLKSLKEQKDLANLINNGQKLDTIYEIYYKIAESIENDASLSIAKIKNLFKENKFVQFKDYNKENTNLKNYLIEENGYRLFIVHDTKLNKCKDVLIENEDTNKISMCYYKGNKSDIQLWKSSDNLKEQEAIFKNLMK